MSTRAEDSKQASATMRRLFEEIPTITAAQLRAAMEASRQKHLLLDPARGFDAYEAVGALLQDRPHNGNRARCEYRMRQRLTQLVWDGELLQVGDWYYKFPPDAGVR